MDKKNIPSVFHTADSQELSTWVENKTTFNSNFAQFSFFETFTPAYDFHLKFNAISFIHMLEGKKVMHINESSFDYFPNESILLKPNEKMLIDFPIASEYEPTRCIALTICDDFLKRNINRHNEFYKKINDKNGWHLDLKKDFNVMKDEMLDFAIKRLLHVFKMPLPQKDFFMKNAIKELLILLMQCSNRDFIITHSLDNANKNRFAYTVQYIKDHISEPIDLEVLFKKTMLCKSLFFKSFKEELGVTPMEFIMQEKLNYAKHLITNTNLSINAIAFQCGFENTSHFTQRFKKQFSLVPTQMRQNG